jgi:hypothetical protein
VRQGVQWCCCKYSSSGRRFFFLLLVGPSLLLFFIIVFVVVGVFSDGETIHIQFRDLIGIPVAVARGIHLP